MTTHRNLMVGDVVLLKYQQQLTKDKFRVAKVTDVHPDKHGNVRTATVELRDLKRTRKEHPNQINTPTVPMTVGVQRLVVILPADETWSEGLVHAPLTPME